MSAYFLLIPILLPIIGGAFLGIHPMKQDRRRNIFVFSVTFLTSCMIAALLINPPGADDLTLQLAGVLEIKFRLDGCGMIFAGLIAFLWPLAVIYAFGYIERRKNAFLAFYVITYGVTSGIVFAGNLMTMYMFYELLTIVTIPLVMHELDHKSVVAARRYMTESFGGAAFGFLAFIVVLKYGNTLDFVYGGVLRENAMLQHRTFLLLIYTIAVFGFGVKAALFPVHGWLPAASVAPTPVTALLHAVAVVKAGAFAIIRITYYSFGTDFLKGTVSQNIIICAASLTILYGSVKAVKEQHCKRRLAYSTVSNLSYIILAAALMSEAGLQAGFLHLLFHGLMKITLFYCMGVIMLRTGKKYLWEMNGIGRRVPLIMTIYTIAGTALIGIPPLCGFISKWHIAEAAIASDNPFAYVGLGSLMISAFLTAIYIMELVIRAWFPVLFAGETKPSGPMIEAANEADTMTVGGDDGTTDVVMADALMPDDDTSRIKVGWEMSAPLIVLTAAIIFFGLYSGPLAEFIRQVAAGIRR